MITINAFSLSKTGLATMSFSVKISSLQSTYKTVDNMLTKQCPIVLEVAKHSVKHAKKQQKGCIADETRRLIEADNGN